MQYHRTQAGQERIRFTKSEVRGIEKTRDLCSAVERLTSDGEGISQQLDTLLERIDENGTFNTEASNGSDEDENQVS